MGLVVKAVLVLSLDVAPASLLLKMRRVRCPNFSEVTGGAIGGTDEVAVAWGRVTCTVGISSSSYVSCTPHRVSP